jgi:hypothetical protein
MPTPWADLTRTPWCCVRVSTIDADPANPSERHHARQPASPRSEIPAPCRRRCDRHHDGRGAQGEPTRPDRDHACRGQRRRRSVHAQPLLRCSGAAVSRAFGRRQGAACDPDQHRQCERRHGRRRALTSASDLRCPGKPARHCGRAGPAVLDRRDHGEPADRSHRSGVAGSARRLQRRPLGRRGCCDHDHRHRAKGSLAPSA